MPYLVFRFDIDTSRCMRLGVPALMKLGTSNSVGFTFFINMGKAISREWSLISNSQSDEKISKLKPLEKLGLYDYIVTILINPLVGANGTSFLKNVDLAKHEFGLHGGRNHGEWMRKAMLWSEDKIENEIRYGLNLLIKAGIQPKGFSSPGWVSPEILPVILAKLDFKYYADLHNHNLEVIRQPENGGIPNIPTNILGEPGGVGYIESCVACGMDETEILMDFTKRLDGKGKLAVMYDHPGFVVNRHLPVIEKLINRGKEAGFEIRTLSGVSGSG